MNFLRNRICYVTHSPPLILGFTTFSDVLVCRSLADTQRTGKLTKEQFCLAMHLIQEKVKGVDPPQSLTPEMIPPSERGAASTPVRGPNAHMYDMHPITFKSRIA